MCKNVILPKNKLFFLSAKIAVLPKKEIISTCLYSLIVF